MADVEIRIAVVQLWVKGIEIAQGVESSCPVAKRGREIVQGVREGVVCGQSQAFVQEIRHLVPEVEGVVMAVALVAAEVHVAVLVVEAVAKVLVPQVQATRRNRVDVGDVIEVYAMRPCVRNGNHALSHIAVQRQIPSLRVGSCNVLVDRALTNRRQSLRSGACQWARRISKDRHREGASPEPPFAAALIRLITA